MTEINSTTELTMHTPGPWTCDVVIDGRANFTGEKIQPQYVINRSGVGSPIILRREAAANARLIEAAPKLVAALSIADIDQIVEAIENFVIGSVDDDSELNAIWQPYIDKLHALRSAILEAGGQ